VSGTAPAGPWAAAFIVFALAKNLLGNMFHKQQNHLSKQHRGNFCIYKYIYIYKGKNRNKSGSNIYDSQCTIPKVSTLLIGAGTGRDAINWWITGIG